MFIKNLELHNFRNHKYLSIEPQKDAICITGSNGVGKTSILEAVSMLSPGKGMLGAEIAEQNYNPRVLSGKSKEQEEKSEIGGKLLGTTTAGESCAYQINASLYNAPTISIESKRRGLGFEKVVQISQKRCKSQLELLSWCDVIWFSAKQQYDMDKSQSRRSLVDRMVFHCDHRHAIVTKEYEALVRSRMAALRGGNANPAFLDALEAQIAQKSHTISLGRVNLIKKLNGLSEQEKACGSKGEGKMFLKIENKVEQMITEERSQEEVEHHITQELKARRAKDTAAEQTTFGSHKAKVEILNGLGVPFTSLSSGQQKLLFLFMTTVLCKMLQLTKNRKPIVLLDEIISFLDKDNINSIMGDLQNLSAQIWMTSPVAISHISKNIQYITI